MRGINAARQRFCDYRTPYPCQMIERYNLVVLRSGNAVRVLGPDDGILG